MLLHYMRKGAKTGLIRYTLFGLLMLAAGGMVFMDVGGFFRGGVQRGDVARVGSEGIGLSSFDRMLRTVLAQQGIGPQDAWKFGVVQQVLGMEIRETLVSRAAADMGLQIGEPAVAARIAEFVKPMAQDGATPQQALDRLLQMQGMSEAQFVSAIRRDMTADLIRDGFASGVTAVPEAVARDLYAYETEERSVAVVFLPDSDPGKPVPAPTQADLEGLYKASSALYTVPERRTLTIAWIDPEAARKGIVVSDEDLKKVYETNKDAYAVPEMRAFSQVLVSSEKDAAAIAAKVKGGAALDKAAVQVTGKKDTYRPAQDFAREGLPAPLADPVFKAREKDVIGPVQTPLGWHVLALEAIRPPRTKGFDEVRQDLLNEETDARAAEKLSDLSDALDDRLAGGATLEETAKDFPIILKTQEAVDSQGLKADGQAGLSAFESDRALLLETAFDLMEGETSAVVALSDGRHALVRVDAVALERIKPLEDVRADLVKRWESQQRKIANLARARTLIDSVAVGKTTLEKAAADAGLKVSILPTIRRGEAPPAPLAPSGAAQAFGAAKGQSILTDGVEGQAIIKVLDIRPGDAAKADSSAIRDISDRWAQENAQADLVSWLAALQRSYGVVVNETLLAQTYGPGREMP